MDPDLMSPDLDPGFFLTDSGSRWGTDFFYDTKVEKKNVFLPKSMMYISSQTFMKDLKLWVKPSAVHDPFLQAILNKKCHYYICISVLEKRTRQTHFLW